MWANTNVETLPTFLDGPVAGPVNCWYGTKGKVHPQKWLFSHPSGASVQVESKTFQELHSKNSATAFIETPGAARKWKTHLHDVSPYSSSGLIYRLCFEKRGRIKKTVTTTYGSEINHLSLQTSTPSTCGANTSFQLFSLLQFISSILLFWYSAQPLC